ncbi:MAG: IclR family transcriptional regulator [Paracoccus sp. (in: a-proteobacteria)]|uniref:IclR family transcriptional regulator n=1 Tax=Paracoccus sp. TaxID=267 RepID=UPI003003022B
MARMRAGDMDSAGKVAETGGDKAPQNNLRPLYILKTVAEAAAPVSAAELGEALDLPKPTIHRLLQTLEHDGWLMRDLGGRGYVAGHLLRRLAANTFSGPGLRRERMAILKGLAEAIGETCNISMPDRDAMVYVDRVETHWPLRIRLPIGTRVPLHCTSAGKTYLSTLPPAQFTRLLGRLTLAARTPHSITTPLALADEIALTRERGHGEDDQEMVEGMIALAVPIRDHLDRVFGTLSFHAPVQRLTLDAARQHLPLLKQTARDLADTL